MLWSDSDGMEDNSRRLSEEGEDSAKKARDTFSVCNGSVGCVDVLWLGVTRKSGNEQRAPVCVAEICTSNAGPDMQADMQ